MYCPSADSEAGSRTNAVAIHGTAGEFDVILMGREYVIGQADNVSEKT